MCDPFSHREVWRQSGQFREQLHGTHLCDAWNADQQIISLVKEVVLSDDCHTPSAGFTQCLVSQYGSTLLTIPAINTEDDDHNPPRVAPRSLFDASFGVDNLLGGDKHKWSLRLTAVNFTNKYALYNFLSTFSGTHYVTPRALTAELGFHF
jgi:hypothetical protein